MSETIDELKETIERLKAKNAQLLEEKRKIKEEREALATQLEAAHKDAEAAKGELQRITVDQPRFEVLEAVAVPGMADVLQREIDHHFTVVRADDGRDWFQTKDGQPVEIEGKPVEFSPEGITGLHTKNGLKIGSMLRGSGATGGGAIGNTHNGTPGNAPKTQTQRPALGFR